MAEEGEVEIESVTAVLYFVVMLSVGLAIKHFLRGVPFPYSGLLLVSRGLFKVVCLINMEVFM